MEFANNNKNTNIGISEIANHLVSKNIELTDEEKQLIKDLIEFENSEIIKEYKRKSTEFNSHVTEFNEKHKVFINNLFRSTKITAYKKSLDSVLNIPEGLITDVITCSDYCYTIVSEMTPVSEDVLKLYQEQIQDPFIKSYISIKNNEIIAKIEANKNRINSSFYYETPKTDADNIFDALMAKYKGKVVYVDFWATWCGPCKSDIEQSKVMKEELSSNENIVFVYITNQTSPENTYKNMIPSIQGDHYRLSKDEWNYLCSKFNISGIPHHVLVGKDGRVIDPDMKRGNKTELKNLLIKHSKE